MRVLVTGGAGFIGAHTVRALVARGDEVAVLDDFSTSPRGRLDDLAGQYTLVEGDVRDPAALDRALAGADRVLHLAALPSVQRSIEDPLATHDVNVTGTVRLLERCRRHGVRRIVVASSSSVYGDPPEAGPKHEAMPARPASPYAASKLAAESYTLAFARAFGIGALALRYFNVFGPGQDPLSPYAAVIPRFVRAAFAGLPVTIHGDGEQTRDFTYVADVVEANLRALDPDGTSGEALNVAGGRAISVNAMAALIPDLVGRPLAVRHGPARPGDVRHSLADLTRARKLLGWEPRVGFAEGLALTVASLRPPAERP